MKNSKSTKSTKKVSKKEEESEVSAFLIILGAILFIQLIRNLGSTMGWVYAIALFVVGAYVKNGREKKKKKR